MKRISVTLLLLSVCLIISSVKAQELTLAVRSNFAQGIIARKVLKEAYHRIGIKVEFLEFPGARALIEANEGRVDGEAARLKHILNEFKNLRIVPVAIAWGELIVVTKYVEFPVNGWESLKPYNIAVFRGAKFQVQQVQGMKHLKLNNFQQMLSLVDLKRTDIALMSRLTAVKEIEKSSRKGLKILDPPIFTFLSYHFLHKKHENWIPQITASLQEMEKEGLIKKMNDQFAK